jgi:hypothetical protein
VDRRRESGIGKAGGDFSMLLGCLLNGRACEARFSDSLGVMNGFMDCLRVTKGFPAAGILLSGADWVAGAGESLVQEASCPVAMMSPNTVLRSSWPTTLRPGALGEGSGGAGVLVDGAGRVEG